MWLWRAEFLRLGWRKDSSYAGKPTAGALPKRQRPRGQRAGHDDEGDC
jgi:hypothetical protein